MTIDYIKYYENQIGSGIPVFRGAKNQKGNGLGNLFRSFYRWIQPVLKTHALPFLKESAKSLGTEAVKTVANIATDAIVGKNFEHSVQEKAQEAFDALKNIKEKKKHY